jgi:hypothetical protein
MGRGERHHYDFPGPSAIHQRLIDFLESWTSRPYTFYPRVLPHWMAWAFFLIAMAGGIGLGIAHGRARGWLGGVGVGVSGAAALLVVTVAVTMIVAFFVHDF